MATRIGVRYSGAAGIENTVSASSSSRLSPSVADRDYQPLARLGLGQVRDHLLAHRVARRDADDRHVLGNQRNRPVLHLAGRVAGRVDVGDFLELERAFERRRVVDAAAEEDEVVRRREPLAPSP